MRDCKSESIISVLGEIGDIETAVTFRSNGTPHFWMSFYVRHNYNTNKLCMYTYKNDTYTATKNLSWISNRDV